MKNDDIIHIKNYSRNADEFARRIEKAFNFNLPRDGDVTGGQGLWDQEINAFASAQTLKSLFFSEDWVFICVDLAANKLSSVPLNVVRKEVNTDGSLSSNIIYDHHLAPLISMPNPWQEYPSWMYNYVVEDVLMGNAINWFAERNGHLTILPSDQVSMRFSDKNELALYQFHIMSHDQATLLEGKKISDQALNFPANEIIHTRRPNPASLLWGLSPFTPGSKPILFNRYSSDYLNSFYLKQATPAMAITMERTVNEELALRQLASFEMAYSGRANQRRTLMLPKGTDAKPLTHSLADQRLVDMIDKNREVIINLLKIPKHELGLQKAGSLGSEEHKIALRNFWESTLIPTAGRIQGSLTQFFRRRDLLADNEFFEFDYDNVDALKDDMLKKAEIAEKMSRTLPLNTVIQKIWQEEAIDDPRADLPLSLSASSGLPFTNNIPKEPEPEPELEDDEQDDKSLQANKDFAETLIHNQMDRFLKIDKTFDDIVANEGDKIVNLSLDLFIDFAEKAIQTVRAEFGGKSIKAKLTPSQERRLKRELEKEFDDLEDQWGEEYNDILRPTIELGYDQMIEFGFNEEAKEQIEALRARDANKRKAILTARGLESFAGISKRTSDKIITEIKRGVENNEALGDLVKRVADTFKDPEANINRARTIARTESLTAASIGQNAAYNNAQEVIPDLQKVWVNTGDLRVRGRPDGKYPNAKDDHWKLQGERRGKNHPEGNSFSNGLEYPRDLKSDDPAKVINCRCTIVLLPPGETVEGL